jgi:hypothetical protein
MFESDAKKSLKTKYNKLTSISGNLGKSKYLKKSESQSPKF